MEEGSWMKAMFSIIEMLMISWSPQCTPKAVCWILWHERRPWVCIVSRLAKVAWVGRTFCPGLFNKTRAPYAGSVRMCCLPAERSLHAKAFSLCSLWTCKCARETWAWIWGGGLGSGVRLVFYSTSILYDCRWICSNVGSAVMQVCSGTNETQN